jgi:hypothetical protein
MTCCIQRVVIPGADEWLTDADLDDRRMEYDLPPGTPWREVLRQLLSREINSDGIFTFKERD